MFLFINIAGFGEADSSNIENIAECLESNAENLTNASILLKQIKPLLDKKEDEVTFKFDDFNYEMKLEIFTLSKSRMASILKLKSIHDVGFSLMDGHYHFINVDEFLKQEDETNK